MDNQTFYDYLIDNALEMFLAHGQDGKILYANRILVSELGYDGNLTGIDIKEVIPPGNTSEDSGLESELVYNGQTVEMMVYRKNKTCFRAVVKALESDNPKMPYVIMINNISDKYSLERTIEKVKDEAEAAAKVKSEFVANVTHELRTPVNGILGNTNILLEKEQDAESLRILHTIEHGCQEMNNLINSILDFSKLEAGKFTLEQREFDFRTMIDYIRSTHMPKITEKGLKFFVTVSPEIPKHIIGDELRIGQVLNNLLSNACKFTHVGKISLEVLKTSEDRNRIELFFMVVDTGIGIDKSDLDKLFKSFSQVDASVSRRYGGTGLGLNISKQLVELMGGAITVESEKNKGTMFSFSIWVDLPESEQGNSSGGIDEYKPMTLQETFESFGADNIMAYGTAENEEELKKLMSKVILCIEMENWEKAETFTEAIKHLTFDAPKEIKTTALKLKMAVQKSDYDKSIEAFNTLKELIK